LQVELHIAFDCHQWHSEGSSDLRLGGIAIDHQLTAKE
jgi:hypothetical protein